jgi:mono/diheme cytochrome c family protein
VAGAPRSRIRRQRFNSAEVAGLTPGDRWTPPAPEARVAAAAARSEQLFRDPAVGCASCHVGELQNVVAIPRGVRVW